MEEKKLTPVTSEPGKEPEKLQTPQPVPWPETPEGKEHYKGIQRALNTANAKAATLEKQLAERDLTRAEVETIRRDLEAQQDLTLKLLEQQQPEEAAMAQANLRRQREERARPIPQPSQKGLQAKVEIEAMCAEAGVPAGSLGQDDDFMELWNAGLWKMAKTRVGQILEERKPKDAEAVERRVAELAEQRYQERLEKSGLKNLDLGTSSSGTSLDKLSPREKVRQGLEENKKRR